MKFTRALFALALFSVFAGLALAQSDRRSDSNSRAAQPEDQSGQLQRGHGNLNKGYSAAPEERKNIQSRSGRVHYGTLNNHFAGNQHAQHPIEIERAPTRAELQVTYGDTNRSR